MPTYADLNQLHPSTNPARRAELEALYDGAEKLERLYGTLLPRREREREQRYQTRLKEAQYRNYLGPIIDYFASMLFVSRTVSKAKGENGEPIEDPGEYWTEFREDCDRGGTDVDDLFKTLLTDAMVSRTGWLRLHQPSKPDAAITDAALFDSLKLGYCWVERLEGCNVLDWETGEDGRLEWAITHKREQRRTSVSAGRKTVVETWEFLTRESVEAYRLVWELDKPPPATQ